MAAAQALFAAMTQVAETQSTENGWTTRKKVSKKGLFECQMREQGGVAKDATCTVKNLLSTRVVAQSGSNAFYCVK